MKIMDNETLGSAYAQSSPNKFLEKIYDKQNNSGRSFGAMIKECIKSFVAAMVKIFSKGKDKDAMEVLTSALREVVPDILDKGNIRVQK
ncbi:hypothetical protein MIDIC_590011 [Alphaproteobacteria bacterium]